MTTPPPDHGEQPGYPRSQSQPPDSPQYWQGGPAGYPQTEPGSYQAPPGGYPTEPGSYQTAPGSYQSGPAGYPQAGPPGYPQTSYPQAGYPQTNYSQAGYEQAGYSQPGYPPPGYPPPGLPGYPGPGGGGAPPPYYSAGPAGPRSGSALTALVLGILGLLGIFLNALLAIVFGIVALVRSRGNGTRGKVMASIGIALGVIWTGLTVLIIVVAVHNGTYGNIGRVQTGGCFDSTQQGTISSQVQFTPCTQPHNGQVVGTFVLAGGSAWPGRLVISREASTGCSAMLSSVLQQHSLASGIRWLYYYPDSHSWSSGDRSASCVLMDPNAKHTGSLFAQPAP